MLEMKQAMTTSEVPQAVDLFSGMPSLKVVKALLRIFPGHC